MIKTFAEQFEAVKKYCNCAKQIPSHGVKTYFFSFIFVFITGLIAYCLSQIRLESAANQIENKFYIALNCIWHVAVYKVCSYSLVHTSSWRSNCENFNRWIHFFFVLVHCAYVLYCFIHSDVSFAARSTKEFWLRFAFLWKWTTRLRRDDIDDGGDQFRALCAFINNPFIRFHTISF